MYCIFIFIAYIALSCLNRKDNAMGERQGRRLKILNGYRNAEIHWSAEKLRRLADLLRDGNTLDDTAEILRKEFREPIKSGHISSELARQGGRRKLFEKFPIKGA